MNTIVFIGLFLLKFTGASKSMENQVTSLFYLDITLQPVSINTTLNFTVTFTCEAIADELTFRVNNKPSNDAGVMNKGFSVTTSNTGGTIRAELQAIAYDYNNNTNIRCRASNDDPFTILFSNTAVLMIQGLWACLCVCMHFSVCLSFFFLRSIKYC